MKTYTKKSVREFILSAVSSKFWQIINLNEVKPELFTKERTDWILIWIYVEYIPSIVYNYTRIQKNARYAIDIGREWCDSLLKLRGIDKKELEYEQE